MSPDERVYVIFNPRSGKGRGARFVVPVLDALAAHGTVEHGLTTGPGDEARLASEALARGFGTIVAVGGDGTWSNVANGILKSGKSARLALVAGGTGCDFAKTVGTPAQDVRASARVVLEGVARRVDVGRIEGRHFLNIAGFGYDIAVLEDSWNVRWLNGDLRYVYCALRQMRSYPGFHASLALDDSPTRRRDLLMLIVANARHFGGAFRIAPEADLADGRLDVVAFENLGFWQRPGLMGRLMRGTHAAGPGVRIERAARLRLAFEAPPAYETDGEWRRAAEPTVTIESVPGALEVLVPPSAP